MRTRTCMGIAALAWMMTAICSAQQDKYDKMLFSAAESGDVKELSEALRNHANIEAGSGEFLKHTALIEAVYRSHVPAVRILLENRANTEAYGMVVAGMFQMEGTALQIAALGGNVDIVRLLLENHAEIEAATTKTTPLILAARQGNLAVVRLLLENHANVEAKDEDGTRPLVAAAGNCDVDVVRILLEHHADFEAADRNWPYFATPLIQATVRGCVDVIRILLENHANIEGHSMDGRTALLWAAEEGEEGAVRILLEHHANPDVKVQNDTPTYEIAAHGYVDIFATLLAQHPAQQIPEDARRSFVQANATFKQAQSIDDYKKALGLYQEALKLSPAFGDAWYNLSKAQEKLGQQQDAANSLKIFLVCSPNDPEARAAQDHIYELELKK
jgi:ankyrin repeat protein